MKATVLDASALLAMFFGQAGMEQVRDLFHKAAEIDKALLISAVNWAEVLYKMEQKKGPTGVETGLRFERTMPLDVVPIDRELAEAAAHLKVVHSLGLADTFAASLAIGRKAELVTADTDFKILEKEVRIVWLS
jgi:PIN domain nuclease of toxin-antitoxin system